MANNEYVNRVDFGDETLIDISDTTAEPEDVIEGQVFYTKSGAPTTGTLGDATTTTHGLMSATDKVKLDEIDSKKAPIIIDSKSGNPIVVNDGIPGLKIYDMKVSFTPKQAGSGDPSPDNIRPITGWEGMNIHQAGKNLVRFASQMGPTNSYYNGYSTWLTNGPWKILDQSIKYIYSAYIDNRNASEDSCVKIWFFAADGTTSAGFAEGTKVSAGAEGWSIVTCGNNADRFFAAFGLGLQPGGIATKGMVEIGETRTDYVAYSDENISISWQTEAGTVYGGELDVLTGTLTVTHIGYTVNLSNMKKTVYSDRDGYQITNIPFSHKILNESSQISNLAKYQWKMPDEGAIPHFFAYTPPDQNTLSIYMALPLDSDDTQDFVMCAILKTPYIIQLSPIQMNLYEKTNIFWSDSNNLEISYPTDTKKYIDAGARDVQINGTSILQNGVANIPKASSSTLGAVKPDGMGVNVNTSGQLYVAQATDTLLKGGSGQFSPVTPYNQHTSAYYALAKLAGVDLANETVTVGQYPESAKIAIQKMLGIYDPPWELIRSDSFTNAESADYEVTVDQYGEPFELMEVVVQVVIPKDANTKITHYGAILFHYGDGSSAYRSVLMNNFTGPKSTAWYGSGGRIKLGNAISYIVAPYSESGNNRVLAIRNQQDFVLLDPVNPRAIKKITFRSVQGQLDYTIYGKRK